MGGTLSLKGRSLLNCGTRKSKMETNQYELSDREKELVRNTWVKLVEKSDVVSVDIFLRIFEQIPQAKQFFPFKNATGEALLKHPYFKGHAMRFFNAVRMTVSNLDAWEVVLIPNLLKLGQQHANIQGFQHSYFDTFRKAMNEVFHHHLGRAYNSETKAAWNKIFSLITSKVEDGYQEGQEINRRKASQTEQVKDKPEDIKARDETQSATDPSCPITSSPDDVDSSKNSPSEGAQKVEDIKRTDVHINNNLGNREENSSGNRRQASELGNSL